MAERTVLRKTGASQFAWFHIPAAHWAGALESAVPLQATLRAPAPDEVGRACNARDASVSADAQRALAKDDLERSVLTRDALLHCHGGAVAE
jgi:hypothetical protein